MEREAFGTAIGRADHRRSNFQEPCAVDGLGTCSAVVMEQIKEKDLIKQSRSLGLKESEKQRNG